MFDRRIYESLSYVYWLSVYMILYLILRALVEKAQLPSATWEQSGSSAEKTNLKLERKMPDEQSDEQKENGRSIHCAPYVRLGWSSIGVGPGDRIQIECR